MRIYQPIGLTVLGLCLCGVSGDAVQGAEEGGAGATRAVDDVALAFQLVEVGRRQKLPESLLSAALILHRAGATPGTDKPTEGELSDDQITPAALLAEAKAMRTDDKALADIMARAQDELQEKSRGAATGPKTYSIGVTTQKPFSINVKLVGKEPADFAVACPLGLPAYITLVVRDANGKTVGSHAGWSSAKIEFTPPANADYAVTISTSQMPASG